MRKLSVVRELLRTKGNLITVKMGDENTLNNAGVQILNDWLASRYLPYVGSTGLELGGWSWKITSEISQGTLPKRVASWIRKSHGYTLSKDNLAELGVLLREHSNPGQVDFTVDFTDTIDWEAGEFGDSGSCFWGGRAQALDILRDAGVIAVRLWKTLKFRSLDDFKACEFGSCRAGNLCRECQITRKGIGNAVRTAKKYPYKNHFGIGRAWIFPHSNAGIVFNGYSDYGNHLEFQTDGIARIVQKVMMDKGYPCEYSAVDLRANDEEEGTLYINNGRGYVVGEKEVVENIADVNINYDEPRCNKCGGSLIDTDHDNALAEGVCEDCWYEDYTNCERCGETILQAEAHTRGYSVYCTDCHKFLSK